MFRFLTWLHRLAGDIGRRYWIRRIDRALSRASEQGLIGTWLLHELDHRMKYAKNLDAPYPAPPAGQVAREDVAVPKSIPLNEGKQEFMERMLQKGVVAVKVDPSSPDTIVPNNLKHLDSIIINLSYSFGDLLDVSESGVVSGLSFQNTKFRVVLPWFAIFAIHSRVTGEFRCWTGDIPEPLKCKMLSETFQRHLPFAVGKA